MKIIIFVSFCVLLVTVGAKVANPTEHPAQTKPVKKESAKNTLVKNKPEEARPAENKPEKTELGKTKPENPGAAKAIINYFFSNFVCTGFFIDEKIIVVTYDCIENLFDVYTKKRASILDLSPYADRAMLLKKNVQIVDKTLGFIEVVLDSEGYGSVSLPNLKIASKPYDIGTKLQIVGLARDANGAPTSLVFDVKIVANDACKKVYPSATIDEKIHGCVEIQNGRHFCSESTGSMLVKGNAIAGVLIYPTKKRELDCKSNVPFIKPDMIQHYLEKSKLDHA